MMTSRRRHVKSHRDIIFSEPSHRDGVLAFRVGSGAIAVAYLQERSHELPARSQPAEGGDAMSQSRVWSWDMPADWDEGAARALAAAFFNGVWDLMEQPERSTDDDDRLVEAAHASRFLWGLVGAPTQWATGEWLLSRAYSVVGRPEPALHHARRCEALTVDHGLDAFRLGFAYEALARASGLAGEAAAREAYLARAWACAAQVAAADDRQWLEENLAAMR